MNSSDGENTEVIVNQTLSGTKKQATQLLAEKYTAGMETEMYNGCKDPRLLEWINRAISHEIVSEAVMVNGIDENIINQIIEYIPGLPTITSCEHVYVVFPSTKGDIDNVAYILTNPEIVVMTLSCEQNEFNPTICGFFGAMTHKEFWAYLDTFPNCYKHMSYGRWTSGYWKKT